MKKNKFYVVIAMVSIFTDNSFADEILGNVTGNESSQTSSVQSVLGSTNYLVSKDEKYPDNFSLENWQLKAQSTYIWQSKRKFNAKYSGDFSLNTEKERGNTATATIYAGIKWWKGSEFYLNSEASEARPISNLRGLGGLSNSENQKGGALEPKTYMARLFLRQSFGFGGGSENIESGLNQMATTVDKNRMVLTAGKLSIIDIFDNNKFSHDGRTQFVNWSFLTHGAFDYAADTKGYSIGLASEFYYQDWVLRIGRFMQPKVSNGSDLDYNILRQYADQIEVQHNHEINKQPGSVKVLVFHNRANFGSFKDATLNGQLNVTPPDLATVRHLSDKYGIGIALEQNLSDDIGIFVRASINDGKRETYAFTEIDKQASGGVTFFGSKWGRPSDALGIAVALNGISKDHRNYIAQGGHGAFMGDLAINTDTTNPTVLSNTYNYGTEKVFEAYYNALLVEGKAGTLWGALDFQHIQNPGYNLDRGSVDFLGYRFHYEFDAQNAYHDHSSKIPNSIAVNQIYKVNSGPYMGLEFYNSNTSMNKMDLVGVDNLTNNQFGGSFTLGEKLNKNLAIEASYDHIGRFIANSGQQQNAIDLTAFSLYGVGILPITNNVDVFGKLGADYAFTDSIYVADRKLGLTAGLGISYWLQNNLEIKSEWVRLNNIGTNQASEIKGHVDTLGVGFNFHL